MLWGGEAGELELRNDQGDTVLVGRFPYRSTYQLAPGRRETFERRAFGGSVADETHDIHLLANHSFDKPLASRAAGSLDLEDSDDALSFTARIDKAMLAASYVADLLAALKSGLVGGVSPGFRVPKGGDKVNRDSDGLTRIVNSAYLSELSLVTKPAYQSATVEARNWQPEPRIVVVEHPSMRWR